MQITEKICYFSCFRMFVNLMDDSLNNLIHVDFRFDFQNTRDNIHFDYNINGTWGYEDKWHYHKYVNPFPLAPGQVFDLKLVLVTLNTVQVSRVYFEKQ